MNGSLRIGNLFGIPFYVHPSWFFVLGLVTLSYGSQLGLILGLILALLLFASVLAHELGHSFVAIRQGIEVKSISLFLFGGLANLAEESKTPAGAFWVAIAGPLVSLMLFGILSFIGTSIGINEPLSTIVGLLASINLALALFNLIPGLPLDGGNVLKALVWKITGSPYKGMIFAGRVGQIIGWIGILLGLLAFTGGIGSAWWYILVGWFLLQNAGRAAQYAKIQGKLAKLSAADAVSPNSPIVSESISLRRFANDYIIGKDPWSKFFVTDEEGRLVGAIAVDDLKKVSTDRWPFIQVKELTQPVDFSKTVKSNQSLLEVAMFLEKQQVTELPVIHDNGVLVGLLEKGAIIKLLEQQTQAKPA